MIFSVWKENYFKMVWRVEGGEKTSYLAGTAHFFPYSFKKSLLTLIGRVETVLLEGPLDEGNMDLVRHHGLEEAGVQSFFEGLDQETITKINREFESEMPSAGVFAGIHGDIRESEGAKIHPELERLKPWMAFFKLWTHFLRKRGWTYSVDMEAYEAAKELGKDVHFLETIEEQVHAMEGIPLEKIVNFLKRMDTWEHYAKRHSKYYLEGDYDPILGVVSEYPTRCESIIDKRDPVLFERMNPYMEKGDTIAFVGTTHIAGITKLLKEFGYTISKYER